MTQEEFREKAKQFLTENPHSWKIILNRMKVGKEFIKRLNEVFPKVASDEYSVQTKMDFVINGLEDFPKCMNSKCSNTFEHRNVVSFEKGFRKHCCPQCAKDSDERKRLYAETCKKKYGVENISQYEGTKKKKEEKAFAKYGVKNVSQAQEVKDKIAATNIERYGAKTFLASEEGIVKRKETCFERYGVDSFSKTPMHTEKMKATNRKNYDTDWPQQNREFMRNMHKRYTFDNMNFDSSFELAIYIWCKDHKIEFEYQPNVIFTYEHDGIVRTYEPDFVIEGKVIEVKGDHFFKEDGTMQNPWDHSLDALYEAKHQCMLKNNVEIWKMPDCQIYVDYVSTTYGKDYLKQFKDK